MSSSPRPTPLDSDIPGGWIETPADPSRHSSYVGSQYNTEDVSTPRAIEPAEPTFISSTNQTSRSSYYGGTGAGLFSDSSHSTAVPTPESDPVNANGGHTIQGLTSIHSEKFETVNSANANSEPELQREELADEPIEKAEAIDDRTSSSDDEQAEGYAAIKSAEAAPARPQLQSRQSKPMTEEDLFRVLSRRRTNTDGALSRTNTGLSARSQEEDDEINNLMSKMFGHTRQETSEEERTRHQGVIFKNLTVKGMGLGAALQPSVGDIFTGPFRFAKNLVTKGPKKTAGKPPVRTLLDDFSGCIRPGEYVWPWIDLLSSKLSWSS